MDCWIKSEQQAREEREEKVTGLTNFHLETAVFALACYHSLRDNFWFHFLLYTLLGKG